MKNDLNVNIIVVIARNVQRKLKQTSKSDKKRWEKYIFITKEQRKIEIEKKTQLKIKEKKLHRQTYNVYSVLLLLLIIFVTQHSVTRK